ncbi:MAG TPA: protein kinase [Thermoanaerobaculia bacterium]|nr:protein kinase [Thermoanaerobaculia bacterium]
MTLASGTRLGPYEILGPIGAGGMGEVYRARDTRLGREVAVKVLPEALSSDSGRLRRFEKEARSASALNHPNIVTIYDIGESGGTSYIAMELVEGTSVRELLAEGALAVRKLLAIAAQVAEGLTKAHAAGIVHRDLKPENVMVTRDGHAKILDFGLAKLTQPEDSGGVTQAPTVSGATEPGIVVGTVAYLSPEQALGKPVDFRSDQFSLGSMLYEMATGKKAFARASAPETMTAIIREEPEPIATLAPKSPAPLRWIVERCLGKEPHERYASTQDLARDLSTLRDRLAEATTSGEVISATMPRARGPWKYVAGGFGLLLAAGVSYWAGGRRAEQSPPAFHRLTYRRGNISGARFAPDSQTILYSAAWDGKVRETFLMRRESTDARSLGFPGAHLWSVSSAAELALGLGWVTTFNPYFGFATLARVTLAGGAPREVLQDVQQADWFPGGKSLAVVRRANGKMKLELPVGKTLYESEQGFGSIRVSPKGDFVAFIEGNPEAIAVVDQAGKRRELSSGWFRAEGLAWSPKGDEVWFSASKAGQARALWAVSLSGRERLLAQVPGRLTLQDIARDGSVLLTHESVRREMVGLAPGESQERNLTWLGYSWPLGLSRDGRTLFFSESSEDSQLLALYVRGTDGSRPVRIGESKGQDVAEPSPDGRWIFVRQPGARGERYELLPTGAGEPRALAIRGLEWVGDVRWFPDGRHLLVEGRASGHDARDYVVDIEGGQTRPVTPEGISESVVSPDGRSLIGVDERRGLSIYPLEGGEVRRVVEQTQGSPMQWSADGKSVYLWDGERFNRILKLDLASGKTELWKEFVPSDPTGVLVVQPMLVAPDGKSYVYTYVRVLSDLYLVEGLR